MMKMFMGLAYLVSALSAYAVVAEDTHCDQYEAQVILTVKSRKENDDGGVIVTLKKSKTNDQINEHFRCPLTLRSNDEVVLTRDQAQAIQVGSTLTGVLYQEAGELEIHLE